MKIMENVLNKFLKTQTTTFPTQIKSLNLPRIEIKKVLLDKHKSTARCPVKFLSHKNRSHP